MRNYDALLEDDNDIFSRSPKSKFFDFIKSSHEDVGNEIIDDIITKYAIMEKIIFQTIEEEKLDGYIDFFYNENRDDINAHKKSVYMELAGNIIGKLSQ
jgi:hypothetical protein